MKKLLIPFSALLILLGCGSDGNGPGNRYVDDIQECVDSGGKPQYTSDRYGDIVHYFGCTKP